MVPEVDLDSWSFKTVPITTSAELGNLDKNAQYAIMVAARSKAVSVTRDGKCDVASWLGLGVVWCDWRKAGRVILGDVLYAAAW